MWFSLAAGQTSKISIVILRSIIVITLKWKMRKSKVMFFDILTRVLFDVLREFSILYCSKYE